MKARESEHPVFKQSACVKGPVARDPARITRASAAAARHAATAEEEARAAVIKRTEHQIRFARRVNPLRDRVTRREFMVRRDPTKGCCGVMVMEDIPTAKVKVLSARQVDIKFSSDAETKAYRDSHPDVEEVQRPGLHAHTLFHGRSGITDQAAMLANVSEGTEVNVKFSVSNGVLYLESTKRIKAGIIAPHAPHHITSHHITPHNIARHHSTAHGVCGVLWCGVVRSAVLSYVQATSDHTTPHHITSHKTTPRHMTLHHTMHTTPCAHHI